MIVAGMMISPEVNLVSLFKLMQKLKLYNTYLGLIISYSVFQFPFTVLLFRSYMLSLPKSVEEAAMLDGCSVIQMFTKIVLPMSKPILFSGALFATMHAWNEYMFATVFVESDKFKNSPCRFGFFADCFKNRLSCFDCRIDNIGCCSSCCFSGISKTVCQRACTGRRERIKK